MNISKKSIIVVFLALCMLSFAACQKNDADSIIKADGTELYENSFSAVVKKWKCCYYRLLCDRG